MSRSSKIVTVLLGASEFPDFRTLEPNRALARSAEDFLACLRADKGMALAEHNTLNLFDSSESVIDQERRIRAFLREHYDAQDLIVYYVGHGAFLANSDYYLILRNTDSAAPGLTGLSIKNFAESLDKAFSGKRVYLILDCCFAAEAVRHFQSESITHILANQTESMLPSAGIAVFAAASKDDVAISPTENSRTMFSDCLIDVLRMGVRGCGPRLSLREVADATEDLIRRRYHASPVKPEIHSPRQRQGDVATVPLFQNRLYGDDTTAASTLLSKDIQEILASKSSAERLSILPRVADLVRHADKSRADAVYEALLSLSLDDRDPHVQQRAASLLRQLPQPGAQALKSRSKLPMNVGRIARLLVPFLLAPISWLFFFRYVAGPGIYFDLSSFLYPFVAWFGSAFGTIGVIAYLLYTLPIGFVHYVVGPYSFNGNLGMYSASVAIMMIYARPGQFWERIDATLGPIIRILRNRFVLTALFLTVYVRIEFGPFAIGINSDNFVYILFFCLGASHVYVKDFFEKQYIQKMAAVSFLGFLVVSAEPTFPLITRYHEFYIGFRPLFGNVTDVINFSLALLLGFLCRREFDGTARAFNWEAGHLLLLLAGVAALFCIRLEVSIVNSTIAPRVLIGVGTMVMLLTCFFVGVRFGVIGVVYTCLTAVLLYIALNTVAAAMGGGLGPIDSAYPQQSGGSRIRPFPAEYDLRLYRMTLDDGSTFGSYLLLREIRFIDHVVTAFSFALMGALTASRHHRRYR